MVQTTFNFDLSLPANPFKSGTQCFALYEWLQAHRRITRQEIHHVLKQDTARIRTDVKAFLREHELDIECRRIDKGNTEYIIVEAGR